MVDLTSDKMIYTQSTFYFFTLLTSRALNWRVNVFFFFVVDCPRTKMFEILKFSNLDGKLILVAKL